MRHEPPVGRSLPPRLHGRTERFDAIACLDARTRAPRRSPDRPTGPGPVPRGAGSRPFADRSSSRASPLHIGRGLSADLRLDDSSVSRRHAILVPRVPGRPDPRRPQLERHVRERPPGATGGSQRRRRDRASAASYSATWSSERARQLTPRVHLGATEPVDSWCYDPPVRGIVSIALPQSGWQGQLGGEDAAFEGTEGLFVRRSACAQRPRRALPGGLAAARAVGRAARAATDAEDFSGGAFQILPPGAEGRPSPSAKYSRPTRRNCTPRSRPRRTGHPGADRKRLPLGEIRPGPPADLRGVSAQLLKEPKPGVEILRDSHDVPHIYGTTRGDVMFGSGWVAAEGPRPAAAARPRTGLCRRARHPRRQRLRAAAHERSFTPSAEGRRLRRRPEESAERKGPRGEQVIEDLEAWVEGVNAYELDPPAPACRTSTSPTRSPDSPSSARSSATAAAAKSPTPNFLAELENKFGETAGAEDLPRPARESTTPKLRRRPQAVPLRQGTNGPDARARL